MQTVDIVKWIATVIQLVGYGLTGMNIVRWNVLAFVIGIALWFVVGFMWTDRAIMIVHIGAFIAIVAGYLSSSRDRCHIYREVIHGPRRQMHPVS